MKKYFVYGLGAVMGLALTACDGYKEPNPPAQYNPQGSVLQTDEVAVAGRLSGEVYDLTAMTEENKTIEVAQIECKALPAGYTFGVMAYISADDFENSTPVEATVKESSDNVWTVEITPAALQTAYNDGISTNVEETELDVRLLVTTILDSQVAIVGGASNFYGPYSLTILPGEPAEIEMEGPFLWTPGASNGWSQENSQRLFSTDGGVTFMGFALLQDEFKFTNAPDWNGTNYGAADEEGMLSESGDAGNLTVSENGLYWCKVNVEELTYELTLISTAGVIGDFNSWAEDAELSTTNNLVWTGNVNFGDGGGFKFRFNGDWGINLGGESFKYLTLDGPNLNAPGPGEYFVTLNLGKLPYSCTVEPK